MQEHMNAKTKISVVSDFGEQNYEVKLTAVGKGLTEDNNYAKFTPRFDATLLVNNPKFEGFFKAGEHIYLTLTKERPAFQQYEDLLHSCWVILRNPGEYNNKQIQNTITAIAMVLGDKIDPDKMMFIINDSSKPVSLSTIADNVHEGVYRRLREALVGQTAKFDGPYMSESDLPQPKIETTYKRVQ